MEAYHLRILLVLLGAAALALIYWFGRPKRSAPNRREPMMPWEQSGSDPQGVDTNTLAEQFSAQSDAAEEQDPLAPAGTSPDSSAGLGDRPQREFDLIVSLHVMARDEGPISGGELIVATEKTSLIYGAQGLFHRLVDGRPELGPIFSVVNRVEPGRFDLSRLSELSTPGISLFMALPCALPALEAWDRMLPAAQRLAGLLNAEVYDDQMHLLGRQRIASIREELRTYDRKTETRVM